MVETGGTEVLPKINIRYDGEVPNNRVATSHQTFNCTNVIFAHYRVTEEWCQESGEGIVAL